jgi:tetratricopeptide (TPR) repeat protein
VDERHRQLIVKYRETFRIDKALSETEKYLKTHPDDPWAFMQISECHLLAKRFLEAEEYARKAFEYRYEPAAVTYQLARIYQEWDQKEMAREHYLQVLDMAPDSPVYLSEAGRFFLEQGDAVEAVEILSKAVSLHPDSPDYLYLFGRALDAAGDSDSSIGIYERYILLQFEPPERYVRLGELYIAKELYEKAVEVYKRLEQAVPEDFNTYMLLGKAYSGTGDYTASLQAFLKASQLSPKNPRPLLAMGQMCRRANDYDRALQVYLRVLALDSKNAEARFGRARIFSERRILDRAEFEAREAHKHLAGNVRIQSLLAAILQAEGKTEEAQRELAAAREMDSDADLLFKEYLALIPDREAPAGEPAPATGEAKKQ